MSRSLITKSGQSSWRVATSKVEAFVTQTGGQLGPVSFRLGDKIVQPFSIAPWAEEKSTPPLPPILKALRGDFFCLPFGANAIRFKGEQHPLHGETANARWRWASARDGELHLRLDLKTRPGRVDKYISLRPNETTVYQRHIITGLSGPMSLGHHAMLKFPATEGSGLISCSRFLRGHVAPLAFENPAERGYFSLRTGGKFRSLTKVPLAGGGFTDLSRYPARPGFEDLVLLESDQRPPFAWTAVTFLTEGYVWFALKDPRVLRQTIFWLSNGGRHYAPWNGRHTNVLGLEEVTAFFHYGLAESAAKNALTVKGQATCRQFQANQPVTVNYIIAAAPIPRGFDRVKAIIPAADGQSVQLISRSNRKICAGIDLKFLGVTDLK